MALLCVSTLPIANQIGAPNPPRRAARAAQLRVRFRARWVSQIRARKRKTE